MNSIPLSEYGQSSSAPSPVNKMMAAFASDFRDDRDINLGVGYVNERTIPRETLTRAHQEVVSNVSKYRAAYNYGGARGSANLTESIKDFLINSHIGGLNDSLLQDKQIIIGSNGATSLLEGIAQVLPRGIVITTDPIYYIYCNFIERMGFDIVAVPEDTDGIDIGVLNHKIDALGDEKERITFFYITTVSNPTCTILSNNRKEELINIAHRLSDRLGKTIPIIFDAAYENLIHDPDVAPLKSGFHYDRSENVYEIGTMSKILAPGLRIGYMIGRDGDFLQAMIQRASDVGFSAPLINQEVTSYMLDNHAAKQIRKVNHEYREKAVAVHKEIDRLLAGFLSECRGGKAGFYYYLTFAEIETHERSAFFRYLTRTTGSLDLDGPHGDKEPRVIYIPGSYCVHQKGDLVAVGNRQLRLSYGFEDAPNLIRAISLMRDAAEYALLHQA